LLLSDDLSTKKRVFDPQRAQHYPKLLTALKREDNARLLFAVYLVSKSASGLWRSTRNGRGSLRICDRRRYLKAHNPSLAASGFCI
jgi:hypothetical protein